MKVRNTSDLRQSVNPLLQ